MALSTRRQRSVGDKPAERSLSDRCAAVDVHYAPDGNEVVGISIWDSPESRERFRLSEVERERRQAMAPFVIEESSGFYVGRELTIPER